MNPGTQLGHYTILSALGKGGMGEVWRARDTKLGREIAIKTLPKEFARDTDRLARFEREAKLLASLNHPNIAAIHGFEEDKGTHFLVMELVEGDTLAERLKRGAIPVEESLKLALQIADALKAAHDKGVIHRDLKPLNIKVTDDNNVKVLDFGLAKAFAGEEAEASVSNSPTLSMQATQQGVILGTAAYMSPEQAKGRAVDKRTDIWAFGCVLYEMLTGRQSFEASDVTESLAAVIRSEPLWDTLPTNLHPRLREVVERCLSKKVTTRFQDIGDVRSDIEKVLVDPSGLTVQSATESVQAAPQSKLPWVAAIVLMGIVASIAAWSLKPESVVTVGRFSHVLPEEQQLTRATRPFVVLSPDGSRMVYSANNQLYSRTMGTLESNPIPGTDEDPSVPFFSPDGEWIGYRSGDADQLKKIAVSGGAPVTLSEATDSYGRPHWGNNGNIVWGQAEGLLRVSENGGTPELLIASEGVNMGDPQILPGGSSVLFHRGDRTTAEVVVQSLDTEEQKVLFPGVHPTYISTGHILYGLDDVLLAVPFDLDTLEIVGGPVPLVEGVRAGPPQYAVSDSGTLVYVPGGTGAIQDRTLALVDRQGVGRPLELPPNQYSSPRLSPDGQRLAVQTQEESGDDIWIYSLSGETAIRRLTQEGNNTNPIWTPDGERITFASDREGTWGIYSQRADGGSVAELLTMLDANEPSPDSWSPDGRTLSFSNSAESGTGIWTLSPAGSGEPELFSSEGPVNFGSSFSPDGQWLAYFSNEDGSANIYVQPFPRTGVKHKITEDGGVFPLWSEATDQLFYRRDLAVEDVSQLIGIDVAMDGEFSWSTEQTLAMRGYLQFFGNRNYDISPDGEHFLMVFPADQDEAGERDRPQINIVLNWFEELKQRVPVP